MSNEIDWTEHNDNRHSFRMDDFIGNLLDKELNKSDFARSAVTNLYEKDIMIKCPTCEGTGAIHGHHPVTAKKTKRRRSKSASTKDQTLTIRCDKDLTKKLNDEKNKTELILMAIVLAVSEKREMECPTCKGAGKIIGGPSVRKRLIKKS